MVDLDPCGPDNIEIPADHLIVYAVHGACQAVLDRQDAVAAQAALDRREHALEILAVQDGRRGEHFLAGFLGIGAFHTLACHHSLGREQRGRFFQGRADLSAKPALLLSVEHLSGPALGHQKSEERPDAVLVFFACLLPYPVQQIPFPFRIQDRDAVFPLIPAHLPGQFHPFTVKADQLIVHLINPRSQFLKLHVRISLRFQ